MSEITKEDISNAIENWRDNIEKENQFLGADALSPAYYEYLKKTEPEKISEEGKEGLDEYIIYCGLKIYKYRPITNN